MTPAPPSSSAELSLSALLKKSKAISKLEKLHDKFKDYDTDQPFVLLLTRLRGVLTDLLWQVRNPAAPLS